MPAYKVMDYKGFIIWSKSGKQAKIYDMSSDGLEFLRDAPSVEEAKKSIDRAYEGAEEISKQ